MGWILNLSRTKPDRHNEKFTSRPLNEFRLWNSGGAANNQLHRRPRLIGIGGVREAVKQLGKQAASVLQRVQFGERSITAVGSARRTAGVQSSPILNNNNNNDRGENNSICCPLCSDRVVFLHQVEIYLVELLPRGKKKDLGSSPRTDRELFMCWVCTVFMWVSSEYQWIVPSESVRVKPVSWCVFSVLELT